MLFNPASAVIAGSKFVPSQAFHVWSSKSSQKSIQGEGLSDADGLTLAEGLTEGLSEALGETLAEGDTLGDSEAEGDTDAEGLGENSVS